MVKYVNRDRKSISPTSQSRRSPNSSRRMGGMESRGVEHSYMKMKKVSREINKPEAYKRDLTHHDRVVIQKYRPVGIVWGVRDTGTHLFALVRAAKEKLPTAKTWKTSPEKERNKWALEIWHSITRKGIYDTQQYFWWERGMKKPIQITVDQGTQILNEWDNKGNGIFATM
jgi:hypothetical protein